MSTEYLEQIEEGRFLVKKALRVKSLHFGTCVLEPVDPVDIEEGDEIRVTWTNPPRVSIRKVRVVAGPDNFATISVRRASPSGSDDK